MSKRTRPIYLDYAASTPADPRVIVRMLEYLGPGSVFANPGSATHALGRAAREAVEAARHEVAALIGARDREVIFTSGATESNNLALSGLARARRERGRHLVSSQIEHSSVLDTLRSLEADGFEVTYVPCDRNGCVDPEEIRRALRSDTLLCSVMHVNNETGVIQDVASIGSICRERGIVFHVDAVQSAGKLPIDLAALPVDLMSFSGHKIYGPKGIGALYLRNDPELVLEPIIHGGGQERGLRAGTLATHQIVGLGEAFRIARLEGATDACRIQGMRDGLWARLRTLSGVELNGASVPRVCGLLSLTFTGVGGESLLFFLGDLALAQGSACASARGEPSHVLKALGRSDAEAEATLRISLGRFTTEDEIESAAQAIAEAYGQMLEVAPRKGGRMGSRTV
ncbi:MAG: cysteine desulfurase family protein [Gammaproteobacteria bacterium]